MSRVVVVGGGRWARVILGVLDETLASEAEIVACSRRGRDATAAWVRARGASSRVRVVADWPPEGADAAIVVNAARDHEAAVLRSLEAGVPVLVEKPMALDAGGAERMLERARSTGSKLAAAHVFLFASYLERFSRAVAATGPWASMRLVWTDPVAEVRYGEAKRPDVGLPVAADVLPHVVSILTLLGSRPPDRCVRLGGSDDGAHAALELWTGSLRCDVELARGAAGRKRLVEVRGGAKALSLDFSVEPGVIVDGPQTTPADPAWSSSPRPLARMLKAFLAWASGEPPDPRLAPELGVQACRLIDQARGG